MSQKTPIWKSIATTLSNDIAKGHYGPGDKLPTEAALAARFGVNRHTVRHALSDLSERGIVRARRGSGVFVQSPPPMDYPLGKRVRFHQNIRASGRLPQKHVLRLELRPADRDEAKALQISPGDEVVVYEGVSLMDDMPVALFLSTFPAQRLPDLATTLAQNPSVTAALKAAGVSDYIRAETRVTAEAATATRALHLKLREGAPLLRSVSLNVTPDGHPVEHGQTWFAGDRIALTVTVD